MNFTRLRYFHSVAKLQSFRRAAEVIGVSQPSLSRQILILEQECGTSLFKRDKKHIILTAAGELLLSRSANLLGEMDDLKRGLADLSAAQSNRILVGAIQSTLDHLIPAAIDIMRKRHPRLRVSVRGSQSSEIVESVSRGLLDVGIVATPIADPRISVELVSRERYFAVLPTSHSHSQHKQLKLADIAQDNFITFPRGFVIRDMIDSASAESGTTLNVIAEIESIEAIKALVRFGSTVSILPESAILGNISAIGLSFVPIDASHLVRDIVAIRLTDEKKSALIDQFVDAMRHAYRTADRSSGRVAHVDAGK